MLLTKSLKMRWNSRNKDYYISKGYTFTKMKDEFEIDVKDLAKQSKEILNVQCDCCGKEYYPFAYNYFRKDRNEDYCSDCSRKNCGAKIKETKRLKSAYSFAEWCVENVDKDFITKYWSEKNILSPFELSYCSQTEVWLKCTKCDYHDEYLIKCVEYVGKKDHMQCPQCSKCKNVNKLDSFGQYIEDLYGVDFLSTIWSKKNNLSPYEVSIYSNKKLWWYCSENQHSEFQCTVEKMVERDCLCPDCAQKRRTSFLQDKVENYLNDLFGEQDILHEFKCNIIPINPKTDRQLPFDNEVSSLKLIVETMGQYHYRIDKFTYWTAKKNGVVKEDQFQYQQWKDQYKKQYALDHGYHYLEIPYTAEAADKYKELIDNKIKEILEEQSS